MLIKNLLVQPTQGPSVWSRAESAIFFSTSNFDLKIFAASLPTMMYSTSFERSDSYLFGARSPRSWHYFLHMLCWLKLPLFHIIQRQMSLSFLPRVYFVEPNKYFSNFPLLQVVKLEMSMHYILLAMLYLPTYFVIK